LALGPIVPNEMNFGPNVVDRVVFTDGGVIFERKAPALIFAAARTEPVRQFLKRYNDRYRL
jgi:cystine transport system ATP-binding protein